MKDDDIIWDDGIVWDDAKPKADLKDIAKMAWQTSVLPHALFGAKQTWDAGAQLLAQGVEKAIPAVKPSRESLEAGIKQDRQAYERDYPSEGIIPSLQRGIGQGAVLGPLTPAMKGGNVLKAAAQGGAVGAEGGALTPVYDVPEGSTFWDEKLKQVKESAGLGGALGGAGHVIGNVVAPKLKEGVKALLGDNIRLTPGQIFQGPGGILKSMEDKATSLPIVGQMISNARRRGIEDFNRAMYSKALSSFGDEGLAVAKAAPVGHEGIQAVGNFLSSKYEDALSKSVPAELSKDFGRSINHLKTMVPKALRDDFQSILDQAITPTATGTITPSVAKSADSLLGQAAAGYKGSSTESERQLGKALMQAQSELRQLFAQSNPKTAPLIRAADQGWRTLVQIENAGAMLGAKEGVFSPAHALNAVKKSDRSVRDRAFARGEAHNQEFVERANAVLPNQVPNSGTVDRLGLLALAARPDMALLAGTAGLGYAPGTSAVVRGALAKRPEWAYPLGDQIRQASPYLGLLGGALAADR
jgi:hypothetical protein